MSWAFKTILFSLSCSHFVFWSSVERNTSDFVLSRKYPIIMKLIWALLSCLILWQIGEAQVFAAESHQFSCMPQQQKCGIYIHDVVKPILEYFTQIKQLVQYNEAQLELKNNEIGQLEKKDNKLQSDMKSMSKQIMELEKIQTDLREEIKNKNDNIIKLQMEMESSKAQTRQFKENESRFQKEIESNNKQIEELQKKIQSVNCENIATNTQKEILYKNDPQIDRSKANEIEIANSCMSFTDSEIHNIALDTIQVQCNSNIAGPGWTVIEQKIPGNFSFNETWSSYQSGFGYLENNFFLGLEKIYRLTNMQPHELYIHMKTTKGETYFARYDSFAISNAHDKYKIIELGNFSGNTKDFMSAHKNMPFSTYDQDNDQESKENCASIRDSGWWYKDCEFRNFKKIPIPPPPSVWEMYVTPSEVRMMIRPRAY